MGHKRAVMVLALVGAVGLIVLTGIGFCFSLSEGDKATLYVPALLMVIVVTVAAAIGIGVYVGFGLQSACPKCGKLWGKVFVGTEEVNRKKAFGLIEREADFDAIELGRGGSPTQHGSLGWEERAPVIRIRYRMLYECPRCDAAWSEEGVKEVEDFSRD